MNDPRSTPVPFAEIEVSGKPRRRVLRVYNGRVDYESPQRSGRWLTYSTSITAWRKWAFNGRVVARGQE